MSFRRRYLILFFFLLPTTTFPWGYEPYRWPIGDHLPLDCAHAMVTETFRVPSVATFMLGDRIVEAENAETISLGESMQAAVAQHYEPEGTLRWWQLQASLAGKLFRNRNHWFPSWGSRRLWHRGEEYRRQFQLVDVPVTAEALTENPQLVFGNPAVGGIEIEAHSGHLLNQVITKIEEFAKSQPKGAVTSLWRLRLRFNFSLFRPDFAEMHRALRRMSSSRLFAGVTEIHLYDVHSGAALLTSLFGAHARWNISNLEINRGRVPGNFWRAMRFLPALAGLAKLHLAGCFYRHLNHAEVSRFFNRFANQLESLRFQNLLRQDVVGNLDYFSAGDFAFLSEGTSYLPLREFQFSPYTDSDVLSNVTANLIVSPRLPALRTLILEGTTPLVNPHEVLRARNLPALRELGLSLDDFTSRQFHRRSFDRSAVISRLRQLSLTRTEPELNPSAWKNLNNNLAHLNTLQFRELRIDATHPRRTGVRPPVALPTLEIPRGLTELALHGFQIDDIPQTWRSLLRPAWVRRLLNFDLSHSQLSHSALAWMVDRVPYFDRLVWLDLAHCGLDLWDLDPLSRGRFPNLRLINALGSSEAINLTPTPWESDDKYLIY